jgi:hypothetical protein
MTTNGTIVLRGDGPALPAVRAETTRAFEPGSITEAYEYAKLLVSSRLLPRAVATPEAAFAIIATGRELGLTALQSLRSIHVIEGRPTLSADLILALVKARGDVCSYFRLVESTDRIATYETQRRGEPAPTRLSWTWEDAQRAGVVGKDNWKRYPAAMLRARAITALARAVYPDLAMGLYDPDEIAPEAAAPAPTVEVSVAPSVPAADDSAFAALAERVDAAETGAALNAIAKDAVAAHRARRLTDGLLASIKSAVTRKRGLVSGKVATPAPAPSVEDLDLEPGEAEAEVFHAQFDGDG